jgi:single-stranded-DNA-specific exonuclease
MKAYRLREALPEAIQDNLKQYPFFIQSLLYYRNIDTTDKAQEYLNPAYGTGMHDPYLMKDMDKAVTRILSAVKNNERILIYSDYDADGIPAAVILYDFFKLIKYENVEVYIPHRHNEGFGLHLEAVDTFKDRIKLLITLDCGIVDYEEVKRAAEHGIDVIVTDHHEPGEKIPQAHAIINAKQSGCEYPYKDLCGSGVAFKLVQALIQKGNFEIKEGAEKWLLDMAGLATLSDMVPLQGENRVLAHYGLRVLRKTRRPGLLRMLQKLNINPAYLTEDDVGFMITPRINAASRMGIPLDAFHLLSTQDENQAEELATHLDKINNERKGLVAALVKEVKKILLEREDHFKTQPVIVIGNPDWRPAILGLAASPIAETYGKPVFLWGREDGKHIKGSCRTGNSVSLVKIMENAKQVFVEYGGHTKSGGFAVVPEKIHTLEDELVKAYATVSQDHDFSSDENGEDYVDAKLTLDDINQNNYSMLEKLAPFGKGNPKPVFMFENVQIQNARQFGKTGDHIELMFNNSNGRPVKAISFFAKPEDFSLEPKPGRVVNLVASFEKSYFRNRPELRLRIVDII